MKHYRILIETNKKGDEYLYIQKRYLFFFWIIISDRVINSIYKNRDLDKPREEICKEIIDRLKEIDTYQENQKIIKKSKFYF